MSDKLFGQDLNSSMKQVAEAFKAGRKLTYSENNRSTQNRRFEPYSQRTRGFRQGFTTGRTSGNRTQPRYTQSYYPSGNRRGGRNDSGKFSHHKPTATATSGQFTETKNWYVKHDSTAISACAGQLKFHHYNWSQITSDRWILNTISGCKIDFIARPVQSVKPKRTMFSNEEIQTVNQGIKELLQKGAIQPTKRSNCRFVSNIFLIPKKSGGLRPVINLKDLNTFVRYEHFKMENIKLVKEIIQSNDFLTSIDLKDAYFAIPMCEIDQSYLCFSWENQFYRFICLPFGLSSAPRLFTKVMKPVIATARSKGIRLVIFIDDILIMASSENESNEQTTFVVQLLEYLGFQINKGKSCLKPQTHSTYLGVEIDSKTMTINVPKSKIHKLKSEGTQILEKKVLTLRNLAKFIGMIIATFDAFPRGKLHFRKLESAKSNTLKNEYGNYDANIAVNQTIREETTWWLDIPCDDVKSSIKKTPITIVICTPAGITGICTCSDTVIPAGVQSPKRTTLTHRVSGPKHSNSCI